MSTESVALTPRTATTQAEKANEILDRIEEEINRLYRCRPQLKERIKKAGNILTAHLAGRPALSVAKVRISTPSGRARFLFRSLSNSGATYVVLPVSWKCSCPDAHRRDAACKHSIAAWTLWKVSQPAERKPACPACQDGIVRVGQEYVNTSTGELVERTTAIPCRRCKGGAA